MAYVGNDEFYSDKIFFVRNETSVEGLWHTEQPELWQSGVMTFRQLDITEEINIRDSQSFGRLQFLMKTIVDNKFPDVERASF